MEELEHRLKCSKRCCCPGRRGNPPERVK
jgi:hypothetical protein